MACQGHVDWLADEWCMCLRPIRLKPLWKANLSATCISCNASKQCKQCRFLLTSAQHCFGNMAEKPLSFGLASGWIKMIGIGSMKMYIFFGEKVFSNEDLHCANTNINHWNQQKFTLRWNLCRLEIHLQGLFLVFAILVSFSWFILHYDKSPTIWEPCVSVLCA